MPKPDKEAQIIRTGMEIVAGAIPFGGGILSAIASNWSESEQEQVNQFFQYWIQMLKDEMREKEQTIIEIMARLDINDEEIKKRIQSPEYQSILKKAFREWAGVENEEKRKLVRNILTNAAATKICSDDVIKMFLDWISKYSDLHFKVIATIYKSEEIGRSDIWTEIGKEPVREDSSDADLYKLLIRDISEGAIARQHKEKDPYGNYLKAQRKPKQVSTNTMKSAFDNIEKYELTELGKQFVHYAMTEITPRIEYKMPEEDVK